MALNGRFEATGKALCPLLPCARPSNRNLRANVWRPAESEKIEAGMAATNPKYRPGSTNRITVTRACASGRILTNPHLLEKPNLTRRRAADQSSSCAVRRRKFGQFGQRARIRRCRNRKKPPICQTSPICGSALLLFTAGEISCHGLPVIIAACQTVFCGRSPPQRPRKIATVRCPGRGD